MTADLAARLDAYLKGGEADDALKAWVFQMQRDAATDRLALALSVIHEMMIWCDIDGDTDGGNDLRQLEQLLVGGDSPELKLAREKRRKFGYYRASLNRVKNWLADGVVAQRKEKRAA